jgi:concanavalin A-like lectin/glucanase superfamily protein
VRFRRRALAAVLTAATTASALQVLPLTPPSVAQEQAPDTSTEAGAVRAARQAGEPVEVTSLRTQTRQVFALPSGVMRMEQSLRPRWIRRGGAWVDADATLRIQADGTVAPVAPVVGLSLSGGGESGPLVRIGDGGNALAFRWPGTLPKPLLDADTATYPEVWPGVDLQVRADIEGFVWALVVKTPQAAANPALRRIALKTEGHGLSLREAGGGVDVVDGSGGLMMRGARPYMWDSSDATATPQTPASLKAPAQPRSRLSGPAVGARRKPIKVELAGNELATVPDAAMLTDPATEFPVVIDPPFTVGRVEWAKVSRGYPNQSYINGGIDGPYGETGHAGDSSEVWRTFYRFNVYPTLHDKDIISSWFHIYLSHSWSCEGRSVQAWRTGGFSASTDWSNQPTWHDFLDSVDTAKGYSASCPAGSIKFNVRDAMVAASEGHWSKLTLGLRAYDEGDSYAWKKFKSNYDSTKIVTEYNSYPKQPALSAMRLQPGGWCSGGSFDNPIPINVTTPKAYAKLYDPDNSVKGRFEIRESDPVNVDPVRASWTSPLASRGTEQLYAVPSGKLVDGKKYRLNITAVDERGAESPASLSCYFRVDTTNPRGLPSVTSTDYPPTSSLPAGKEGVGKPGRFTLSGNGDIDVVAFRYGLDDPDCTEGPVKAGTAGGAATITATPRAVGPRLFYAAGVDAAGNWSQAGCRAIYEFTAAAGAAPVAHFKFDENTGTTSQDTKDPARVVTFAGGTSWTRGRIDKAVTFNGTTGYGTTAAPVVNTSQAFTVSAWVQLSSKDTNYTAVSQAGNRNSGFQLYYSATYDRWIFNRHATDTDDPVIVRAMGTKPPTVYAWTHLLGVYDPGDRQIRLYVNGRLEGWASFTPAPWHAAQGLQVGRVKYNGAFSENFAGNVDNIRIWQRVASEPAPEPETYFPLDEGNGAALKDVIYEGRSLGLSGASQVDNTKYGRGLSFNGSTAYASTSSAVVRTDQAFTVSAWVKIANKNANWSALSQPGSRESGFQLYYSKHYDRWIFGRYGSDTDNSELARAMSAASPTLQWTHLLGIYDPVAKQVRLVVNGRLEGSASFETPWHASAGGLQVGRTKHNGEFIENFNGQIDEVKVWDFALDGDPYRVTGPPSEMQDPADPTEKSEIWREANLPLQLTAHWKLNETTGTTALSEFGNRSPLTLANGAALIPDNQAWWTVDGVGLLKLDGVNDEAMTPVKPFLRSDRSFSVAAWVRVTNEPSSWTPTGKTGASAISQDGTVNSAFQLRAQRYTSSGPCDPEDAECFKWTFTGLTTNDTSTQIVRSWSEDVVQYEAVHMAGVYDMTDRQLRLYANGSLVRSAQVPFTTAWVGTEAFRIGTGKYKGSFAGDFFPGQVDEVQLYAGVLTQEDVLRVKEAAYPLQMVQ